MVFVATGGIDGVVAASELLSKRIGSQTIYRVFGGEAQALGKSWTPTNPTSLSNYRNAAGLPNVNTGQFVIQGSVRKSNILLQRAALPLDGNAGGVMEYIIKNPNQIKIYGVYGVNPPF